MSAKVDIGINEPSRQQIAEALSKLLADTYVLYSKTHSFHWNVTGPNFPQLHEMFGTQYNELWTSLDDIAERIRTLGVKAPASPKAMASLASIKEAEGAPPAEAMVKELLEGHETAIKTARPIVELAQGGGDEGTVDLVIGRIKAHEKTAWMLRATLG
ncbi:MAG: DNA starvation/stationary phase protection protein [Rhodospirillaceae bacterium]|nr:DNA starvation/stationary phase protection protein [Rhodospirillaceae bacterium]